MKKSISNSKIFVCLLAFGLTTMSVGCSDGDYDLSNVDTTIGIGGDGLTLPTSNTENIMLDDVLELNNSDFIFIEDNGDYVIKKDGENVSPAHPNISKVSFRQKTLENFDVEFDFTQFKAPKFKAKRRFTNDGTNYSLSDRVAAFDFHATTPKEILDLVHAGTNADVKIKLVASGDLKRVVKKFNTLDIVLPEYMKVSIVSSSPATATYDEKTSTISMNNVSTGSDIVIDAKLVALDFNAITGSDDNLSFKASKTGGEGTIDMKGNVGIDLTFDSFDASAAQGQCKLSSSMTIGTIVVEDARGKFNPSINLSNLGNVNIGSVPDFLTDGDVKVNLYNPVIELTVNSDIDVPAIAEGVITATGNGGQETAKVAIPAMDVKPNAVTKICICKYPDLVDGSKYDVVKQVSNLSDLLMPIPKHLAFSADVKADVTKEGTVQLGKSYTVQPNYSLKAPLAFDKGAQIVYRDTLDGWNDDIKDLELADGTYLELKGDVDSKIPAYLLLEANAIGVDGKIMPKDQILVEVSKLEGSNYTIKGSEDGQKAVSTPLTITLKENTKGALSKLDGLTFLVKAAAGNDSAIVGKTINAKTHTLVVRNIKVKLVGKIIADFN